MSHTSSTHSTLFAIPLSKVTQTQALETLAERSSQNQQTRIVTINPEFILTSLHNVEFRKTLQTADLQLADGIGLIWATHLLQLTPRFPSLCQRLPRLYSAWQCFYTLASIPFSRAIYSQLPERVTGSDLFIPLLRQLAASDQSVFLLGGAPGVAEATAQKVTKSIPNLTIAGTYVGSPAPEEAQQIINTIKASGAQALFVAFQFPKQDIWIHDHLPQLPQIKVAIGIGGTFDFIAGTAHLHHQHAKAKRAPKLIQRLQLEWLWRLFTQPHRWKRIWNATGVFIGKVWQEKTATNKSDCHTR
ncbi:WecB/TagA/CpsF family glycosyltransferase [Candidatus Gracilibacteria bacterium]|nr:WecB/TagA/CpsF family glycosyltransferase [Candidatus Gracilibacteria bacterium]